MGKHYILPVIYLVESRKHQKNFDIEKVEDNAAEEKKRKCFGTDVSKFLVKDDEKTYNEFYFK